MRSELKSKRQQELLAKKTAIAETIQEFLDKEERQPDWLESKTGVNRTTIWRILKLKVYPNEATVRALAEIVGEQLLVVAGYAPLSNILVANVAAEDKPIIIPKLANPLLGVYLSKLGELDSETQEKIAKFLENELAMAQQEKYLSEFERPDFAKKLPDYESAKGGNQ